MSEMLKLLHFHPARSPKLPVRYLLLTTLLHGSLVSGRSIAHLTYSMRLTVRLSSATPLKHSIPRSYILIQLLCSYCMCSFRSRSVNRHCNIELIFGVMLHFNVIRCMHSRREIVPRHPIRLRQTRLQSWREKLLSSKVVRFRAALVADVAAIGFGEAENAELAACYCVVTSLLWLTPKRGKCRQRPLMSNDKLSLLLILEKSVLPENSWISDHKSCIFISRRLSLSDNTNIVNY